MRALAVILSLTAVSDAAAEVLVATRMIPAQTVLQAGDLGLAEGQEAGALTEAGQAIGKEARVALFPGRAIRAADLTAPGLVDRNQIVALWFRAHGLTIRTEGRALERGAEGEVIRVMNLQSRMTTTGRVMADGSVAVGP